jgi:hypothetical protein
MHCQPVHRILKEFNRILFAMFPAHPALVASLQQRACAAKLLRDQQLKISKALKLPPLLGRFYRCKDSEETSDET